MPEPHRTDDVEKLLSDQKALDERKQAAIEALLKERDDFNAAIDEKLAKLGYAGNESVRRKRSHHKKAGQDNAEAAASKTAKPKA